MLIDEMREAVRHATLTLANTDKLVGDMAALAVGRLRSGKVPYWVLSKLKRELRDWNMHTGCWKER